MYIFPSSTLQNSTFVLRGKNGWHSRTGPSLSTVSSSISVNVMKWGFPMETALALNLTPSASNGWSMNLPSKSTGTCLPSRMGAPMLILTVPTSPSSSVTVASRSPARVCIVNTVLSTRPLS